MRTQLDLFKNAYDWFNQLTIWEQSKRLIEQFRILERLRGYSQADRVLWHLENFGQITNLQCHEFYGIRHAPSVIRDLRKKFERFGSKYEITNDHRTDGCDKFGNSCTFDIYKLVEKDEQSTSIRGNTETDNSQTSVDADLQHNQ